MAEPSLHEVLASSGRKPLPALVYACGFSWRKRAIVRRCLVGVQLRFVRRWSQVPSGATLLVWGKPAGEQAEVGRDLHVVRLEDGFLRSVGLGADLVRPLSWVVDTRGIYFDATQASDLEHILLTHAFDAPLLKRAAALRERIVLHGLTKYNVGSVQWQRPAGARQVILVPGQVEGDASLAWGAPGIRRNLELLRAVRQANPQAHVVYKPHPDVVAGLRRRGQGEGDARHWCDDVVTDAPMHSLLAQVDEVHTLTSLAGFEALLRGKKVVCYGQPFYAGWGLTTDMLPPERRTRRLALDELVAGVLVLYPTYLRFSTGTPCSPEQAMDDLLAWRKNSTTAVPWWRALLRPVLGWFNG